MSNPRSKARDKIRRITIGSVTLDETRPRVIAPFTDKTPLPAIKRALKLGLDLLEARIDLFGSHDANYVADCLEKAGGSAPIVATIRSRAEGGGWRGAEARRFELFSAVLDQAAAVDIELEAKAIFARVANGVKRAGKTLIVSYHDFKTTPDLPELESIIERAKATGADIVKIAATPKQIKDIRTLSRLLIDYADQNLIVVGMGAQGLKTRLLFPALGSLATYAFIDRTTAPGQLSVGDTIRFLKLLYPR